MIIIITHGTYKRLLLCGVPWRGFRECAVCVFVWRDYLRPRRARAFLAQCAAFATGSHCVCVTHTHSTQVSRRSCRFDYNNHPRRGCGATATAVTQQRQFRQALLPVSRGESVVRTVLQRPQISCSIDSCSVVVVVVVSPTGDIN